MNLGIWAVVAVLALSLLRIEVAGECVISQPLRVNRICGQVLMAKGNSLPGTLRLTRRDAKGGAKSFERIGKTNDDGQFDFKDVPAGMYEVRLIPIGMREVFDPVLVDLRHPKRNGACVNPIDLKLDFLPESCVSPELRKLSK